MTRTVFYPINMVEKRSLFVWENSTMKYILIVLQIFAFSAANALAQFPEILWEREGAGPHSQYGAAIMPLGDQNDDGFADWAVLGIGDSPPDPPNQTVLEFFHGGNPPDPNPYKTWLLEPDHMVSPFYGFVCGDLNGDGYMDWYIAYKEPGGPMYSRTYEIYFGGPYADEVPDFSFSLFGEHWIIPLSGNSGNRLDFNGDGYDDLAIYHQIPLDYTEILFGGETMDSEPDWIIHSDQPNSQSAVIRTTGDFNGDGSTDLFTSNNTYPSRTSFFYMGGTQTDTLADEVWTSFGASYASGESDLNHDGKSDLAIGYRYTIGVHFGRTDMLPEPDVFLTVEGCDNITSRLSSAGDFNHDGYDDLVAISPGCAWWGKLNLYLGSRWMSQYPAFSLYGRTPPLDIYAISEAEGVGDTNGDGIDDLAIGGWDYSTEGERGKAVIISGDTSFIAPVDNALPYLPDKLQISLFPNPVNSMVTLNIEVPAYSQAIDIGIYNLLGQRIDFFQLHSTADAQLKYNVSELPTGVYLVSATAGLQSTVKKLVVIK
jgi:hypothetical protein